MTELDVRKLFAVLLVVWPEREITDQTVAVYHRTLRSLPYRLVDAAVAVWIEDEKWFPRPAELRDLAFGISDMPRRYGLNRASVEAWWAAEEAPALPAGEEQA